MKLIIAICLLLATSFAFADTWISATTVSYHLDRNRNFNEVNPGLGVEYGITENAKAIAGFYKNSIYKESAYAGAAWTPISIAKGLRIGVVGGIITGYRLSPAPMLIPVAMLEGGRFGINVLFVPHVIKDAPATFALQVKIKLN